MEEKKVLIFGKSGKYCQGHLSSYPGSALRTMGLSGIRQPYAIYVHMAHSSSPYEQRTKLTNDDQDPTNYKSGFKSTEHLIGHGEDSNDKVLVSKTSKEKTPPIEDVDIDKHSLTSNKKQDSSNNLTGFTALEKAAQNPLKITEVELNRKLQMSGLEVPKKKKKSHKFNLY